MSGLSQHNGKKRPKHYSFCGAERKIHEMAIIGLSGLWNKNGCIWPTSLEAPESSIGVWEASESSTDTSLSFILRYIANACWWGGVTPPTKNLICALVSGGTFKTRPGTFQTRLAVQSKKDLPEF